MKSFVNSVSKTVVFAASIGLTTMSLGFTNSRLAVDEPENEVPAPKVIFQNISKIFSIENGFDSNDNVEVTIMGYLPSTCYKLGKSEAKVDHTKRFVYITSEAYVHKNEFCIQVQTPFIDVVELGMLKEGDYTVVSMLDPAVNGKLSITKSLKPSQDDFLYAPVDSADIEVNEKGDQNLLVRGAYPYMLHGCMKIKEVQSNLLPNNVLVVQPITQIFEDGDPACNRRSQKFKIKTPLAAEAKVRGEGLIHVRTLNGKSLNTYINEIE